MKPKNDSLSGIVQTIQLTSSETFLGHCQKERRANQPDLQTCLPACYIDSREAQPWQRAETVQSENIYTEEQRKPVNG